jgi:hypothetical protein
MSTPITTAVNASRSMAPRVRRGPRYRPPLVGPSRKVRLAEALDCTVAKAEKLVYGPEAVNHQCARVVASDVKAGDLETALAFIAPIEAALGGAPVPLFQALHEAELADNAEQNADESFREKLRQGTATIDDAKEYIRKSAAARHKAEEAERAAQRWIEHQEAR